MCLQLLLLAAPACAAPPLRASASASAAAHLVVEAQLALWHAAEVGAHLAHALHLAEHHGAVAVDQQVD